MLKGRLYRNKHMRDVDMYIFGVLSITKFKVFWIHRDCGRIMESDIVTVKPDQIKDWKLIV